jgi:hypothetical protein
MGALTLLSQSNTVISSVCRELPSGGLYNPVSKWLAGSFSCHSYF